MEQKKGKKKDKFFWWFFLVLFISFEPDLALIYLFISWLISRDK